MRMGDRKPQMPAANELAVLDAANITEEQMHDACIVLLGHAISVAGTDVEALRRLTRPVFTAIGAVPYESWPRTLWGSPQKEGRPQ